MASIKVYSTQVCPYCKLLKAFLKEHAVEYEEVDVSSDRKAAEEMIEKSGQMGVPQTEINGRVIVGFDREALEKELEALQKSKD